MIIGLAKLGLGVAFSYVVGAKLGDFVVRTAMPGGVSPELMQGAEWGGRAVAFVGVTYLLSKV